MSPRANLAAFWLLGLCNNFAYVIMLSAAKDILEKDGTGGGGGGVEKPCNETLDHRECAPISTGSVLLADIIPSLLIKVTAPLFISRVPFDIRHLFAVILQAASFILVAVSDSAALALSGVVLASLGSGLGEVSYLSLSSHFSSHVVTAWSSGTGGAGVFGALAYATLTDQRLLRLSPKQALLAMLVVPVIFIYTFWFLLKFPRSVHRVKPCDSQSYIVPTSSIHNDSDDESERLVDDGELDSEGSDENGGRVHSASHFHFGALPTAEKIAVVKPLILRYMLPLSVVYFAEYFINQGLLELLIFDCSHGWGLSEAAQYRWFQVLYQIGVFISRTAGGVIKWMPPVMVLATLQLINACALSADAVRPSILPHFGIVAAIVLYEGLLGGSAYVHTFKTMHRKIPADRREFSLGFVSIADTGGILLAGMAAIPVHNAICALPL